MTGPDFASHVAARDGLRIGALVGLAFLMAAFVAASAYGYLSSNKPGEPPIRFTACYGGFWPSLAFGPGLTFGAHNLVFGPDFYRTRMIGVTWPGGALGAFIVPLCPQDIPAPEDETVKD